MARDHLLAAAKIVAREAERLAARFSVRIPPSIRVSATGTTARISSQVGPAYPNEVPGVRHPVYGNRQVWVTNDYRPFLAPAADATADAVAEEIAKTVDDIGRENGFIVI